LENVVCERSFANTATKLIDGDRAAGIFQIKENGPVHRSPSSLDVQEVFVEIGQPQRALLVTSVGYKFGH
jgi:hypothetical protein